MALRQYLFDSRIFTLLLSLLYNSLLETILLICFHKNIAKEKNTKKECQCFFNPPYSRPVKIVEETRSRDNYLRATSFVRNILTKLLRGISRVESYLRDISLYFPRGAVCNSSLSLKARQTLAHRCVFVRQSFSK